MVGMDLTHDTDLDRPPTILADGSPADHRDFAGCRRLRRARSTGTIVGLYDGFRAGMANEDDEYAQRWALCCESHSFVSEFDSLAGARSLASAPEQWCEVCQADFYAVHCTICERHVDDHECMAHEPRTLTLTDDERSALGMETI